MDVNMKKYEETLRTAEVIYLSTSLHDVVSARPVSPMTIDEKLYIRTAASSRKAKEMLENPNIAVCVGPYYFSGKALCLGSAFAAENAAIKSAYVQRYPGAFAEEDAHTQSDDVFFVLDAQALSEWVYEGGVPVGLAWKTL